MPKDLIEKCFNLTAEKLGRECSIVWQDSVFPGSISGEIFLHLQAGERMRVGFVGADSESCEINRCLDVDGTGEDDDLVRSCENFEALLYAAILILNINEFASAYADLNSEIFASEIAHPWAEWAG